MYAEFCIGFLMPKVCRLDVVGISGLPGGYEVMSHNGQVIIWRKKKRGNYIKNARFGKLPVMRELKQSVIYKNFSNTMALSPRKKFLDIFRIQVPTGEQVRQPVIYTSDMLRPDLTLPYCLQTQAKNNFNSNSILGQFSANFHLFDESCRWVLDEH